MIVVGQGAEEELLRSAPAAAAVADRRVRYLHIPDYGLSLAHNAGVRATSGEIIAMIDDNCEAHQDWLAAIMAYFAADPTLGVVVGSLIAPPSPCRGVSSCLSVILGKIHYD